MNKNKKILWFLLSFVLVLAPYVFLNYYFKWNEPYGFIPASLVAVIFGIIAPLMYAIFRHKNIYLAKGFMGGLFAIVAFLFSIGGCGFIR